MRDRHTRPSEKVKNGAYHHQQSLHSQPTRPAKEPPAGKKTARALKQKKKSKSAGGTNPEQPPCPGRLNHARRAREHGAFVEVRGTLDTLFPITTTYTRE